MTTHETQSNSDTGAAVDSELRCSWNADFEEENSPRCTTGKPALYYSCNAFGPVCEDHKCRCRPSLLAVREANARRRAQARAYVRQAIDGALEQSGHDPIMMPWDRSEHDAVLDEVRKIRDGFSKVGGVKTGSESPR